MRNVLKNYNLFLDGIGFLGACTSFTPPNFQTLIEGYRAGGLDAPVPIDMGMEMLESSFVMGQYDRRALSTYGRIAANTRLRAKGALVSVDGAVSQAVYTMSGSVTGLEPGEWQPGQRSDVSFRVHPVYVRLDINGVLVHEIDVLNFVRIINGVDQMAAIRAAIS